MSFSPFDHPILSGLLGDDEVAALFSAQAELAAMLHFEVALARAQAAGGLIPDAAAVAIAKTFVTFSPDIPALRAATAIDGVAVPELLRQLRQEIGEDAAECLHVGATSQDVIDTALMMRLKPALAVLEQRLSRLIAGLDDLAATHGAAPLMGHTRMQAALPIATRDRIAGWVEPCRRNLARLRAITDAGLPIQLGGPVGNLAELGEAGPRVRALCAAELGLADAPQWHSQRDLLAEIANTLSLTTGSIGKLGQDVALMAQAGTIELGGGGGSSAMPHKRNPVAAEMLVSLARFNATQLAGLHQTLVHEQERSGAGWTLEWMLLPQMVCATAASLRHAASLVGDIRRMGDPA